MSHACPVAGMARTRLLCGGSTRGGATGGASAKCEWATPVTAKGASRGAPARAGASLVVVVPAVSGGGGAPASSGPRVTAPSSAAPSGTKNSLVGRFPNSFITCGPSATPRKTSSTL